MPSATLNSFPGLPGTVVRALDLLVRMPRSYLLTFSPLGLGHWRLVVDFRWSFLNGPQDSKGVDWRGDVD